MSYSIFHNGTVTLKRVLSTRAFTCQFGIALAIAWGGSYASSPLSARYAASNVNASTLNRYGAMNSLAPGRARCDIYTAGPPRYDKENRVIIGVGGRGDYCVSSAQIRVSLKTQGIVSGPAATLIIARRTVTNREVQARYPCKFPIRGLVFVEVESEGRRVRSASVNMEADTKDCRP